MTETHSDYPHLPGRLHDCPACEARCHCTIAVLYGEETPCVFDGPHLQGPVRRDSLTLPDGVLRVYEPAPDTDDASRMYVLDVLGATVLVRLVTIEGGTQLRIITEDIREDKQQGPFVVNDDEIGLWWPTDQEQT